MSRLEEHHSASAKDESATRVAMLEHALRHAEARFTGVVEIAADAIISVNEEQRITFFNEGAERIFGYSAEEVIGHPLDLLIPGRFRASHSEHVRAFGAGVDHSRPMGHRREISALRKGGAEFPAEASISKFRVGNAITYTVVLRDISERKRSEDRQRFLAEAGSLLSGRFLDHDTTLATLARLSVPELADYCTVDVIDGNGAFVRIAVAHVDPEKESLVRAIAPFTLRLEPHPHPIVSVLSGSSPVLVPEVSREMLETSCTDEMHRELLRQIGPHSMISVPLLSSGRILGAFTLFLTESARIYGPDDLTLAMELAVRAANAVENARLFHEAQDATRARDDMLGIVAHDLRNPLSTILLATEVMLEAAETEERAPQRRHIEMVRRAAGEMQQLIQDLLDVKRVESGRLVVTRGSESAAAIVADAVELLRPLAIAGSLVLESNVLLAVPRIFADDKRIQQVLSNLVGNAIKFTPKGGRITIGVEREGLSDVRISVRDTGPGIPPDQLPHIFGRFWQGKRSDRRGIGLGLAIVKGIVDAHEGRVWVESRPGDGSEFIFTIPIASGRH